MYILEAVNEKTGKSKFIVAKKTYFDARELANAITMKLPKHKSLKWVSKIVVKSVEDISTVEEAIEIIED